MSRAAKGKVLGLVFDQRLSRYRRAGGAEKLCDYLYDLELFLHERANKNNSLSICSFLTWKSDGLFNLGRIYATRCKRSNSDVFFCLRGADQSWNMKVCAGREKKCQIGIRPPWYREINLDADASIVSADGSDFLWHRLKHSSLLHSSLLFSTTLTLFNFCSKISRRHLAHARLGRSSTQIHPPEQSEQRFHANNIRCAP